MRNNLVLLGVLLFCLTVGGVGVGYYLGEKKSTSHVYVGASGGNVEVMLGKNELGMAPIKDYLIASGWYELQLKTDDYTYSIPLRLTPRTATVVDWQVSNTIAKSAGVFYELTPIRGEEVELNVTSVPERAALSVDDEEEVVFSPTQIEKLEPGKHTLRASLPGYRSQEIPFMLTPGYQLKLTIKLGQD
jgi:hypothetical protein